MPPLCKRFMQLIAFNLKKDEKSVYYARMFLYNLVRAYIIATGEANGVYCMDGLCTIHDVFWGLEQLSVNKESMLPYYMVWNALDLEDAYMQYSEIDINLWIRELIPVFAPYGNENGEWVGVFYDDYFESQITQRLC